MDRSGVPHDWYKITLVLTVMAGALALGLAALLTLGRAF